MADAKPTGPKADDLAKDLKASLVQRRTKPWKIIIGALVFSVINLAFFTWWLFPRRAGDPLLVVALDTLATNVEDIEVRVQLVAPPSDPTRSVRGQKVIFHEPPTILQGGAKPNEFKATSDEAGRTSVDWPAKLNADFQASFVDVNSRPPKHTDSGRVFVKQSNTPLLLVDIDETLPGELVDDKASATLTKMDKAGWLIVYLTLVKPEDFRTTRARLLRQPNLPRGPILGRYHVPDADSAESARQKLLLSITERFRGSVQALVSSATAAEATQKANVPAILIGDAPAPERVPRVASWSDVPLRLKDRK